MWRRGRNRDGGHFCDLCNKGPMLFAQWQQHENGQTHERALQEYERHYWRVKDEHAQIERMKALQLLMIEPFWEGDLRGVKEVAFDHLVFRDNRRSLSAAWRSHVRRMQSDLLLLAITKAHLLATFDSVNTARESFVAMEDAGLVPAQIGGASLHWRAHLSAAATQGHILLRLIMACVMTPPIAPPECIVRFV